MALYVKTKKLDFKTGDPLVVLLHRLDAEDLGVKEGQKVVFGWRDIELYVVINLTDTEVEKGEVGLYYEIWESNDIPNNEIASINLLERPDSIEYIKSKIMGKRLSREQIYEIMQDISDRKIREVEIAYFMACFFNPGFDDEEVRDIAVGMARAGDIIDFTNISGNGKMVVDKHSIGGIAGKGVTPILVPIIASENLIIPNTSTRAITTPAGTSDILEVVMPVSFTAETVKEVVKKTNACMVWGGSMKLAPADDVLISVEKELHAQAYGKLIASIVAKKISMGITDIVVDIPYGKSAKVKTPEEADMLGKKLKKTFNSVGINCETFLRFVTSPDGRGIGPVLEMRDILRVLERDSQRALSLEKTAVEMAGVLLEMAGKAQKGKGRELAQKKLDNGDALKKFWEIALSQGAQNRIDSINLVPGDYTHAVTINKSGNIRFIDNHEIVKICRALGNPTIKNAGIYFKRFIGESVKPGDVVMMMYASSPERLDMGITELDVDKLFEVI